MKPVPSSASVTSGGMGGSTFQFTTNSPKRELICEIRPRKYAIKVQKEEGILGAPPRVILTLDNINGTYADTDLVLLLFDIKDVLDEIIATDDDEEDYDEDEIEEEVEEEDDDAEDDTPPPPSRSSEQADGATFCNCPMCAASRVK